MSTTIQFNFSLDKGRLEVLLEADVQHDEQGTFFQIKNFRMPGSSSTGILPEIKIKKIDGHWVHGDSGWQTALSEAVGRAIEKSGVMVTPAEISKLQRDDETEETADGVE